MIEIKITDPHLMQREEIYKTAKYLMGMVGLPMSTDMALLTNRSNQPPVPNKIEKPEPVENQVIKVPPVLATTEEAFNPFAKSVCKAIDEAAEKYQTVEKITIDRPFDLDSAGLPWDARIHSRGKSKNADGRWRYARGTHDHVIKTVEAELHQAMSAKAPVDVPSTLAECQPPYVPPASVKPLLDLTPPRLDVPVPPVTPQVFDHEKPQDFPALMQRITGGMQSNKLTPNKVFEIVKEFGLPTLPMAATRPDLIPSIIARVDEILGG